MPPTEQGESPTLSEPLCNRPHQFLLQDRRHLLHLLAAAQHPQRADGLQHGDRLDERGGLLRRLRRLPRPRHVLRLRQSRHLRLPQRELQQRVQVYLLENT